MTLGRARVTAVALDAEDAEAADADALEAAALGVGGSSFGKSSALGDGVRSSSRSGDGEVGREGSGAGTTSSGVVPEAFWPGGWRWRIVGS